MARCRGPGKCQFRRNRSTWCRYSNAGTLTLQNTHVTANGAAGGGGDSRDYAGGGGGPLINGASMGTVPAQALVEAAPSVREAMQTVVPAP